MIIEFILAIIAIEAVTEIIVSSQIAEPLRAWCYYNSSFLHKLVNCGYCTSVWISVLVSISILGLTGLPVSVECVILTFALHRLSNVWHEFVVRWLNRSPFMLHLTKTETVIMEENHGKDQDT